MKLPLDQKFVATSLLGAVLLVLVVVVVNMIAGPAAALLSAGALGTLFVKLSEKLDYSPAVVLQWDAPKVSASAGLAIVLGALVVWGASLLPEIPIAVYWRVAGLGACSLPFVFVVSAIDWLSYIVAGWIIGRSLPSRAVFASTAGGLAFIAVKLVRPGDPRAGAEIIECLGGQATPAAIASLSVGVVVGIVARGYLVVAVARMTANRAKASGSEVEPPPVEDDAREP